MEREMSRCYLGARTPKSGRPRGAWLWLLETATVIQHFHLFVAMETGCVFQDA
jgi:hypothetical protein